MPQGQLNGINGRSRFTKCFKIPIYAMVERQALLNVFNFLANFLLFFLFFFILVGFVFVVAFFCFVLFGLSLFLGRGNLNSLLFVN